MVRGTVKSWDDDVGWGVLTSPDVPQDVWAHYSAIDMAGFRTVQAGQAVAMDVVDLGRPIQDGYRYRAERVVVLDP